MFPASSEIDRSNRGGGERATNKPTPSEQRERLRERFRKVIESFQTIRGDVGGLVPEQVIVLETIGDSVEGLASAASKIDGLEWLAELDIDDVTPQHGFALADDPAEPLPCRLYAMVSNQNAISELLRLWNDWTQTPDKRAAKGFGSFKNLFINLLDIRRWSVKDRIEATGVMSYLQERLTEDDEIRFEVELWCRKESIQRETAFQRLQSLVEESGGTCISQCAIPAILYHGVLVKMAARETEVLIDKIIRKDFSALVQCDEIMFFRPHGQSSIPNINPDAGVSDYSPPEKPIPDAPPVVAVLDGLPFDRHSALQGRLLIDDPDEFGERYEVEEQQHGTAMASLIVHGELQSDGAALSTQVYCRPILCPVRGLNGSVERVPDDELLVDLIFRAVRRIFEGNEAVAPTVRVINLSIGDPFRPFDREMSPLARLLDWMAWKYRVLFVVSAGNQPREIRFDFSMSDWDALSSEQQAAATLQALHFDQAVRRNLSPSESLNAITVGATHVDASKSRQGDRRVDLLNGRRLPSPLATICNGFRRSVKPDIMAPGGRQVYDTRLNSGNAACFEPKHGLGPPGQEVAVPPSRPMELNRTGFTRGSSNAAAIASRTAALIHERLVQLATTPGGESLANADMAVLLKCLLAHGADWGAASEFFESTFQDTVDQLSGGNPQKAWRIMEGIKSRFMGYGEIDQERSLFCTDERVTLLGWGSLNRGRAHRFDFPLPDSLSGLRVKRKMTVTIAWNSPVNFQHQKYRQAQLWLKLDASRIGVSNAGIGAHGAQRGSVEHRVFVGESAVALDNDTLPIHVNCKEDAGRFSADIPYGIAVSLEVAHPLSISPYTQIAERLRARIEIDPHTS